MGETGCGKTRLIRYMCNLTCHDHYTTNMLILKVSFIFFHFLLKLSIIFNPFRFMVVKQKPIFKSLLKLQVLELKKMLK